MRNYKPFENPFEMAEQLMNIIEMDGFPLEATITIPCKNCNHPMEVTVKHFYQTAANPEVREQIMDGSFGVYTCEKCGRTTCLQNNLFLLDDTDPDAEGIYMVLPDWPYGDEIKPGQLQPGEEMRSDYNFRLVEDYDRLREKVWLAECGLDDRVIELLKLLIIPEVNRMEQMENPESDEGEVSDLHFEGIVEEEDEDGEIQSYIEFGALCKNEPRGNVKIDAAAYFDVWENYYEPGLENGVVTDERMVNLAWANYFMDEFFMHSVLKDVFS